MQLTQIGSVGVELEIATRLSELDSADVQRSIREHRLLVLRGVPTPTDDEMLEFCSRFGEVFHWEFGAFNELKVDARARNYLYTKSAVPFHWDGAFAGHVPQLIFFYCQDAFDSTDAGGETVFCDTTKVLPTLSEDQRERFSLVQITYSTEKIVHYGGSFTSPLICEHPITGEPTIRYAEPVKDINPVQLDVQGLASEDSADFFASMHELLYRPDHCYDHLWRQGDIVLADNHALLHGRRSINKAENRHLRRVNIL